MDDGTRLLVDAMNVVGSRPTGWWRDPPAAVRALADRLDRYAAVTGATVTLVVDGRPTEELPEGAHGRIEVRYARRSGPDAADDRIVALLAGFPGDRVVVTADRELRRRAREHGADLLGPQELLRRLDAADAAAG